jgi:hypothetical protein
MYASTNVQGDIIWVWAHHLEQDQDQQFHHKAVRAEFDQLNQDPHNNLKHHTHQLEHNHKFQHKVVKAQLHFHQE